KDVPFYWTDNTLDIPILKTPGGKFVDVLRGSNDKNKPDFDMDSDGYPDVWLDTSSIFPKGYKIEETEVYWLNPWEYYRTGDSLYYEDIDHDGKRAIDFNGDGVVDVEEPGDKIRVWKVTWDIGKVAGYEYFDPYCYYEIWIDPPDLVLLSAGVGKVFGKLDKDVPGMFFPYTKDITKADKNDPKWKYWMETDQNGNPIWKQFILQRVHNYEGFTFIDTAKENYRLKPTDECIGTVPQPHREFIAVLSLGGRDIDMNSPVTSSSQYSNLTYKTIFNETRNTPIRTTYTYYAPLPNPLQFEYLTNCFEITDTTGTVRYQNLPMFGKALLKFTMDASTEYSYYWIRNAGHDVDYNDPSERIEGVEKLGDGVFGYLIYDLPKGIGGYKITLPKKPDGSYDIDRIVKIDGKPFQKWLDNKNTKNNVEIFEDPFQYHIYIPQLLIPPALDDDNNDGIDDWIDDRGDRFHSSTGFLHDPFMLGNGEDYKDWPKEPFQDDIYGTVTSGWYPGEDNTYGDDKFEKLGKTRIEIQAIYEGLGKEGTVEISKGGWLVVEEIFGGSPWVITSHTLSGFAVGSNLKLTSRVQPSSVKYGLDTTYIIHTIEDVGEPHYFNTNFDPFHLSYGYGDVTITTYSGGRDPSNLLEPNIVMPTIIDPKVDNYKLTILPYADTSNPILKGYPKQVEGTFLEVRVEINNSTDYNFCNLKVEPVLPSNLKNTSLVFSYVVYPRPLVPAKFDPSTGKIIQGGDDFGTLRTGWRFNQPEGEMLVTLGNTLNMLQAGRRAYFIFLFKIDSSLTPSVYTINFKSSGDIIAYSNERKGQFKYEIPFAQFSISKKKVDKTIVEYQKFVIGQADLKRLDIQGAKPFSGLKQAKWSQSQISYIDFDTLSKSLKVDYNPSSQIETIDLSSFKNFPSKDFTKFYVIEKVEVNSSNFSDKFDLTKKENLIYEVQPFGDYVATDKNLTLSSVGPRITHFKRISAIDGKVVPENASVLLNSGSNNLEVSFYVINIGSDVAENVNLAFESGKNFVFDSSAQKIEKVAPNKFRIPIGLILPGEMKEIKLYPHINPEICVNWYDNPMVVDNIEIMYNGARSKFLNKKEIFTYLDDSQLDAPSYDLYVKYFSPNKREVKPGETININWEIGNGLVPLNSNIPYDVYAIINFKDTILLYRDTLSKLDVLTTSKSNTQYTLPDSLYFLEFMISIDTENSLSEICKGNNKRIFAVELIGPDWMRKVNVKPNPFDFFTFVSYVISQDISKLDAYIYSLDGSFISKIENCPHQLGYNNFYLQIPELAKGTYLIRFEGITPENNKVVNYVKVIKEK
ncbi:MAG: T9SS type A sorting domain-containing protein, partial [Ignavibacteria bacterium]|nr:T9SS type A sorting domain-containing protein [Ignavibacteria bacterium]